MHPAPNPSGIAKKIIQIILFETELPNSPITVRAVLTAATFPVPKRFITRVLARLDATLNTENRGVRYPATSTESPKS